jgi:hypothetical protein
MTGDTSRADAGAKSPGETPAGVPRASGTEAFTGWKDLAARLLGDPEGKWREAGNQLSACIRENPGKTMLAGLGVGLAIGILFPPRSEK